MTEFKIKKYWNELYILKECDPFDTRTDKEFCEENKINYGNFRNWKCENRRSIYEEVNRRRGEYTAELRAKARKALAKKIDSDTNALKLAFQLMGDLVEKQEIKAEHYTQEDIKRRLNELLQSITNRKKTWEVSASGDLSDGEKAREVSSDLASEQQDHKESGDLNDGERGPEPGENPPVPGAV